MRRRQIRRQSGVNPASVAQIPSPIPHPVGRTQLPGNVNFRKFYENGEPNRGVRCLVVINAENKASASLAILHKLRTNEYAEFFTDNKLHKFNHITHTIMKSLKVSYFAGTKLWWLIIVIGVLLVIGGFAYWLWPVAGYAVASQIFGWLVILAGIVVLCVAAGPNHARWWGWWLAGGVIDLFVGFMLVRSVLLSELVFPWFLALLFVYWGVEAFVGAAYGRGGLSYWWLGLINGVLLCIIGFFFVEASWVSNMEMVSFLSAIAFIYWGFTLCISGYYMRPQEITETVKEK